MSAVVTGVTGVVVADDDPAVRAALVELLDQDHRFEVLASVADGLDLAVALRRHPGAGAVVLDVRMPGGGPPAARSLVAEHPGLTVVAVSASTERTTVLAMLRAGVHGYLAKGSLGAALPDHLAACLAGERVVLVPRAERILAELDGA